MSLHETIIQYIKISLGMVALVFVIGWGMRVAILLEKIASLQELNNNILILYLPTTTQ